MPPSLLTWKHEDEILASGVLYVAGVDEAGRGCLAGPVAAAALIFLSRDACPKELNDSKQLSRKVRQQLYEQLSNDERVIWSVATASVEEIDQINILRASHLAMKRAVDALKMAADFLLVDGLRVPLLGKYQRPLVDGDALSPSIAAASIIAKETRDRLMEQLHLEYPVYGFAQHKGYGTPQHLEAIDQFGITPIHRRSFAPVRQVELNIK
jgi:ribonuclease HII